MSMTNVSIETMSAMLNSAIESGNVNKTLAIVLEIKEKIHEDPVSVKWITEPVNIRNIHDLLVEHLDVPPKMMMLKNKVPNRQQRAKMFVQALENGIRKVL